MRALIGTTMAAALALFAPASTSAQSPSGNCQTELKPTDGYRELSAMLKCLNDRIKALETSRTATAAGAPESSPDIAPAMTERTRFLMDNTLQADLGQCAWSEDGDLSCSVKLTNLTNEDRKICFGTGSRLVTDKGVSFSATGGITASVGSAKAYVSPRTVDTVCDAVPPVSMVEASLRFHDSKGKADAAIQFLRFDCGAGCAYEAYKIPIK